MRYKIFLALVLVGLFIGAGVLALPSIKYENSDVQFRKAIWDVTSSTGTSGQVLSSTGTSTRWVAQTGGGGGGSGNVSTSTEGYVAVYASSTAVTGTLSIYVNSSTGYIGFNTTSLTSAVTIQDFTGNTGSVFSVASSTGEKIFSVWPNGSASVGSSSIASNLQFTVWDPVNKRNTLALYRTSGRLVLTNNVGGGTAFLDIDSASAQTSMIVPAASDWNFKQSTNNRMMIRATTGYVGIATTTPDGRLTVYGLGTTTTPTFDTYNNAGKSTFKILDSGDISTLNNGYFYEASTSISYIASAQMGPLNFEPNAGIVSWVDMNVSTTLGTVMAYSAQFNSTPMFTIYSEANGSTGIQNQGVGVLTSTPRGIFAVASSTGDFQLNIGYNGVFRIGRANIPTVIYYGSGDGCSAEIFLTSTPAFESTSTAFCNP